MKFPTIVLGAFSISYVLFVCRLCKHLVDVAPKRKHLRIRNSGATSFCPPESTHRQKFTLLETHTIVVEFFIPIKPADL